MEIYETTKLQNLKRLGVQVEHITAYGDVLLVYVKAGELLQYTLNSEHTESGECLKWECKTIRGFSKKSIVQMSAVPEFSLLLHISDGTFFVHDLHTFEQKSVVSKLKGVTLFAIDIKKDHGPERTTLLQLCLAAGRKLVVMIWLDGEFVDTENDLNLIKVPKTMMWCKNAICVGFIDEYFMIRPGSGALKELITVGSKRKNPLITRLPDNHFLLGYDDRSIFINERGKPFKDYYIMWSDVPHYIVYDEPYLLSLLPKHLVEIRSEDPPMLIQVKDLKSAKLMCHAGGRIFVASSSNLWCLTSKPKKDQIPVLTKNKQYKLALHVADLLEVSEEEKVQQVKQIKTEFAFYKFMKHDFEASMNLFKTLDTDPSHVIGLFPDLLPVKLKNRLVYPEKLPTLEGSDLEKGLLRLIDYLHDKKKEFKKSSDVPAMSPIMQQDSDITLKTKDQLFSVIDTTLLKCYLHTNIALVAPLLRVPDNHVHEKEAEKALIKCGKYNELVIMYEQKGHHEKALELLKQQAHKSSSTLRGTEKTIGYLQGLGEAHLNMIFMYSEWVLRENPLEGLRIFTEDLVEVEHLPRGHVLSFLERIQPTLAIPYLEHVINVWHDETEELHNRLADLLREKLETMTPTTMSHFFDSDTTPAGNEGGEMGEYRKKLLRHIETSQFYNAETLLHRFPMTGFYEERAILLGRLGRHEQALGIYIILLKSFLKAEEHCYKYYQSGSASDKDVYLSLLSVLLYPPDASSLGLQKYDTPPTQDVKAALEVLRDNASCIDTTRALNLLPDDIKVKDVFYFLSTAVQFAVARKNEDMVRKRIQYTDYLQICEERIAFTKTQVDITEDKTCDECHRRIGISYFARFPNGAVVHYACCKDPKIPPTLPSRISIQSLRDMMDDDDD